jgi:hypothetical protein
MISAACGDVPRNAIVSSSAGSSVIEPGYAAGTTNRIAERARISIGT